jgi:hypothetical protein
MTTPQEIAAQIHAAEERLRLAMLAADLESLDALIAPELVFTTHLGTLISKQDDLDAYRSGALRFQSIEPAEQRVLVLQGAAYVAVRMRVAGVLAAVPFAADLRFSRVWQRSAAQVWRVVAGQVTAVQA